MMIEERLLELEALFQEINDTCAALADKEYTDEEDALTDRNVLRKLKNQWHAQRQVLTESAIRKRLPSEMSFSQGIKRLDGALQPINLFLQAQDQMAKEQRICEIAQTLTELYPAFSAIAFPLASAPHFADSTMLNLTVKERVWKDRLKEKAAQAAADIEQILSLSDTNTEALIFRYIECGDLAQVTEYRYALDAVKEGFSEPLTTFERPDRRSGRLVLDVKGRVVDLEALLDQAEMLGLEVTTVEDHMPKPPYLVNTLPASFVSVDLETTGSWGTKNGDRPSEIMEIGAVKVIDGEIVDRFDLLVDPERHITGPATKITHITDEMVKGQPTVKEGVAQLMEFAGDLPWVGHDLIANDIPFILRAATPIGITVSPACFDTFHYASAHKEQWQLEGLSLKALSEHFGIEHGVLHRAVEDAEVTAKVALEMVKHG